MTVFSYFPAIGIPSICFHPDRQNLGRKVMFWFFTIRHNAESTLYGTCLTVDSQSESYCAIYIMFKTSCTIYLQNQNNT